jgi:hypothetical protein
MQTSFRSMVAAAAVLAVAGVAQAHQSVYLAFLSGPNEAPPNSSPATGNVTVTVDMDLVTMRVQASFSGLLGNTTVCHIHGLTALPGVGTAGVMTQTPTFPGFPVGVTSGTYDATFDLTLASSYNPAFITASGGTVSGAMNRLIQSLDEGRAYFNLHTSQFPGGEIRGFLVPTPGAAAVLGMAGLVAMRRRRA